MRVISILSVISCFCLPLLAEAAEPRAVEQVYVVDMRRVLNESILGKAAREDLVQAQKQWQLKLQTQKRELDDMKRQLEKQASLLSAEARQEKIALLRNKERELMRALKDQQEELSRNRMASVNKVANKVNEVISDLAEKRGLKFVLDYDFGLVVYADERLDLTAEVVQILDDTHVGL